MAVEVDVLDHISDLLASEDTKNIKELMGTDDFRKVIEERANDLIPIASYYFTKDVMDNNFKVFRYAEKLVMRCAEQGHPKECLMEYLAQIESKDEIKFKVLLKPLQITMLRIPERKVPLTLCVFNAIYTFINSLAVPVYQYQDKNSKLLLDCDESSIRIRDIYNLVVEFYEPFVTELNEDKPNDANNNMGLRHVLIQALFQLLGNPLVFLDLEFNEKGCSAFRSLALIIVKYVLVLKKDPLQFLTLVDSGNLITVEEERSLVNNFSSSNFQLCDLSVAVFSYIILSDKQCSLNIPCVYDTLFVFQSSLSLVSVLLQHKETLVLQKGLFICKIILSKVEPSSVFASYLESNVHRNIIQYLSNIAVFHNVEEDRKQAVCLIKEHFLRFSPKGRFYILLNSSSLMKHPNINGLFTTILTTSVRETFNNAQLREYFTGKRLQDLINIYCRLEKGAESDLIENKDQILSALNLIIFLTKRDRQNLSGLWNYTDILIEKFFNPLREAINLSRAHYKLQLRSVDEPLKTEERTELAVTVEGQELGKMSSEEKKQVLNSGLTVFDLIEHLLSRATECIEDKPDL